MTHIIYDAADTARSHRLLVRETGIYCFLGVAALALLFVGIEWEAQNAIQGFVSMLSGA